MSSFDAYYQWLGIPPSDQPPNHYRLLGIGLFEPNPEVISDAADSCMAHIRSFQLSAHSEDCDRLLNEIARARLCLLNVEKRAAYDRALRDSLPSPSAAALDDHDTQEFLNALADRTLYPRASSHKKKSSVNWSARVALGFVIAAALFAIAAVILIPSARKGLKAELTQLQGNSAPEAESPPQAAPANSAEGLPSDQAETRGAPSETLHAHRGESDAGDKTNRQRDGVRPAVASSAKEVASQFHAPSVQTAVSDNLQSSDCQGQAPSPVTPPGGPEDNELSDGDPLRPSRMGKFVTALCRDLRGNLWVGTEDTGVWRYDADAAVDRRWAQFTRSRTGGPREPNGPVVATRGPAVNCLGDDNAYALACDMLGRIWVGHLNHGVSVFNGKDWRNYDVLCGPLGERVFAIKTCPVDGDVWIATSAGLSRYRLDDDTWAYYTRADGLAADEVQCLAFDRKGTLYAGTQCDGLAVCKPIRTAGRLEYKLWRVVAAADAFQDRPPALPCGEGLPSNLLNDVHVARDGSIYVATTAGLAVSRDGGHAWRFVRGQDWEAKARGLSQPPPKEFLKAAANSARAVTLLLEDYVTCLAEDDAGNLWIGHREKGCEVFDPRTGNRLCAAGDLDFPTRLLPDGSNFLVSTYGAGLSQVRNPSLVTPGRSLVSPGRSLVSPGGHAGSVGGRLAQAGNPAHASGSGRGDAKRGEGKNARLVSQSPGDGSPSNSTTLSPFPALPLRAAAPSVEEIQAMAETPSKPLRASRPAAPLVVALNDDWRTQGDWLGRYGRYWACCSAICSPKDYLWGAGREPVSYAARIGPHCAVHDWIRYWVHWLYTDNRRSLEMPPTYLHSRIVNGFTRGDKPRRQAEWDDHGEAYPRTHEGPDVYCTLNVPDGLFFLSVYDFNKDGHAGANRLRDYKISIRCHDAKSQLDDVEGFELQPELAHARLRDFWGGVWKRFLVQGPSQLTIRLSRNYSINAILAGVMLDLVDEEPSPYFVRHSPARSLALPQSWIDGLRRTLDGLNELRSQRTRRWAICSRRLYVSLMRAGFDEVAGSPGLPRQASPCAQREIGTCAYFSLLFCQWEAGQAARGLTSARNVEKALRWDGKTYSCEGMGRSFVGKYVVAEQKGRQ